jgi:hypothetical protein
VVDLEVRQCRQSKDQAECDERCDRGKGEGSGFIPFVFEGPSASHDASTFWDVGASDDCPAISFAKLFHFNVACGAPFCTVGRSHCVLIVIWLLSVRCHGSCACDSCVERDCQS